MAALSGVTEVWVEEQVMSGGLYDEIHRPQFHFSAARNWLNDPNGLVYYEGEYHLFFQYNPFGCASAHKHWGHAVSADLVHWTELPVAIFPDHLGEAWSGSAAVDWDNTAGFQTGPKPVLVAVYTSQGYDHGLPQSQSLAYSVDRGRVWHKYVGNPVLSEVDRDPRIFRHQPSGRWIMALFQKASIVFFSSPDLKRWTRLSAIEGFHECPDLFELPVDGEAGRTQWVLHGANGEYLVGEFDGATFKPQSEKRKLDWGNCLYAPQTWNDVPDGRRVQIGWAAGGRFDAPLPGMPYSQFMTFPVELSLRRVDKDVVVCRWPVREIENIRTGTRRLGPLTLRSNENALADVSSELLDIELETDAADGSFVFELHNQTVVYDAKERRLTAAGRSAPLEPVDGRIGLRILVDRSIIEIFGNGGLVSMSCYYEATEGEAMRPASLRVEGGQAHVTDLSVSELRSVWDRVKEKRS
ncbi:MAG: glycoside hydrolase family 32 protein [Phycisphaerae bacterium]|nr:glycoside hydrolase family 32 protein [Phycisphaerae bacterium]